MKADSSSAARTNEVCCLPDEIAKNEEYADEIGRLLPDDEAMFQRLIDPAVGERVLDAGCGTGLFTEMCVRGGGRVVAVDFSAMYCRRTEERVKSLGDYSVVRADLRHLPFRRELFDKVTCIEVLEHIPQEFEAMILHEFRRVLKSGGILVLHTPSAVVHRTYGWVGRLFPAFLESKRFREVCCDPVDLRHHISKKDARRLRRRLWSMGFRGRVETYRIARATFGRFTGLVEAIRPLRYWLGTAVRARVVRT